MSVLLAGGRADRTRFLALKATASQKRFDLVFFWSLDRFSREGVRATLRHLEELEAWGVDRATVDNLTPRATRGVVMFSSKLVNSASSG